NVLGHADVFEGDSRLAGHGIHQAFVFIGIRLFRKRFAEHDKPDKLRAVSRSGTRHSGASGSYGKFSSASRESGGGTSHARPYAANFCSNGASGLSDSKPAGTSRPTACNIPSAAAA